MAHANSSAIFAWSPSMTRLRNRLVYIALVSALITAALIVRYVDPFFVSALRLIAFDYYQRLAPGTYDPKLPVRVVDIDAASLAKVGQWPWPRTTVAKLLDTLTDQGAVAVVFDILFAEPDQTSLEQVVKRLPKREAQQLSAIAHGPTNDQVFAAALKKSPSVLPIALGDGSSTAVDRKAGLALAGDDPRPFLDAFSLAASNMPQFNEATHGLGAYNWLADRDQIVRRVALMYRFGPAIVPSLAAEALRVAQGATTYVIKSCHQVGKCEWRNSFRRINGDKSHSHRQHRRAD
jgi:adenylate cyclase